MKELVVLIGPAASGKSTYCEKEYPKYIRVSADEIRFRILHSKRTGIYFDPKIEKDVWEEVWRKYEFMIDCKENIVFDATNLTLQRRYPIVARARKAGYKITFVWFKIPFDVLMKRDQARDRHVGIEVLMRQWLALQKPEEWEYDELIVVKN